MPVMTFDVTDNEYINGYVAIARKRRDPRTRSVIKKEAMNYIGTDIDPRSEAFFQKAKLRHNELIKKWGVYCLAERSDNLLMWSHYGASYSGVCLELESSCFEYLSKVKYQSDRPIIRWLENTTISESSIKGLFTKSDHWAYEEEWRAMASANFKSKIGPKLVKKIIFGPNCSDESVKKIIEIVKKSREKIDLARAVADDRKFEIKISDY